MEEAGHTPEALDEASADSIDLPITRDQAFVRLTADTVFVIARSAIEIELALVVQGPDPVRRTHSVGRDGELSPGPIKLEASLSEIGRVRLDGNTAMNMSLHIIERLLGEGAVEVDRLRQIIDQLIARTGEPASDAAA